MTIFISSVHIKLRYLFFLVNILEDGGKGGREGRERERRGRERRERSREGEKGEKGGREREGREGERGEGRERGRREGERRHTSYCKSMATCHHHLLLEPQRRDNFLPFIRNSLFA
jgi:hypothetical protein